ncbi:MAG TPA: DUF1501 domain-containing protein, partial [Actinomycetota bacterium]|nr:DUF1501 domain-containing protein [Actinomycetota bacterium]
GDVLVLLSLRGGMDGVNVIVPTGDPDYLAMRPNIGIPQGALVQLDQMFGLHPAMAALKPCYDAGVFGVVHAAGMSQPNRSHFEAMEEMERAAPGTSLRTGWIDRVLGGRISGTAFQGMQLGSGMAAPAFRGPSPELAIYSVDSFGLDAAWDNDELTRWSNALRGLYTGAQDVLLGPANVTLDALTAMQQLKDAGYTPANGAVYPDTDLGHAFSDLARLIKANVGLQVAAIDYGDWDMHEGMGSADAGWLHDHLSELSGTLAALATDLGSDGLQGVTLATLTEFGRCVGENGSGGADHGYGQAVLLLGGGVVGGQVHGQWPGCSMDDLIDEMDLAVTTDYRGILAEILEKRCRASGVSSVFPGLGSDRPGVVTQKP